MKIKIMKENKFTIVRFEKEMKGGKK